MPAISVPASDVKKRGWRGLMRQLTHERALIVTNHNQPEAVIVGIEEYARLVAGQEQAQAREAAELEALRRKFDDRLAALRTAGAGDRLRALARRPAKLRRRVKAGSGF